MPLRPEIVRELKAMRPAEDATFRHEKPVFWYAWPTYDVLHGDLKRAGIPRLDALGRAAHFHSFRKTWQTLGVRYGISQRVAQEVLGHSDANLTAKIYTDVPALSLHAEIAKLPWIEAAQPAACTQKNQSGTHTSEAEPVGTSDYSQIRTQKFGNSCHAPALADLCAKFVEDVNISSAEELSHVLASLVTSWRCDEMAARAGIEPATK